MSVEQKRSMVDQKDQVSVVKQCDLLDINRSTF